MIAMYNAGAAIFRAMGNSNVAMKTSLLMNSINVFGNALLIFGFHRGVEGVAIPTVVSRGVACVVILILLNNQEHELHILHPYPFKIKWNVLKKILYIGIRTAWRTVCSSLEDRRFKSRLRSRNRIPGGERGRQ